MPRESARINVDIWSDDDFRDLTAPAQALYFKLTTHPGLTYAGTLDWHPGRIAALSREETVRDVMIAAGELSHNYFCVFDQDTDEVLVRSFLRHDGLLKQERLHVSVAKAFGSVASNKIRAVIVHELQRYKRENPDLKGWDKPQMRTVLKQSACSVRETETEMDLPLAFDFSAVDNTCYGQRFGQRLAMGAGNASTAPTTSTSTATSTSPSSKEDAAALMVSSPQALVPRDLRIDKALRSEVA